LRHWQPGNLVSHGATITVYFNSIVTFCSLPVNLNGTW
jgi:hypothetical protein